MANDQRNAAPGGESAFRQVSDALCDARQPYDVLFFPDGALRPDALTLADLAQYRTLILPDAAFLTPARPISCCKRWPRDSACSCSANSA